MFSETQRYKREEAGTELAMEYSVPEEVKTHTTWIRLNKALAWYEHASKRNQHGYKALKTIQIVLAASIPYLSAWAFFGKQRR